MLFPFRNYPGRFNGYNLSRNPMISRHPDIKKAKLMMFQILFDKFNGLVGPGFSQAFNNPKIHFQIFQFVKVSLEQSVPVKFIFTQWIRLPLDIRPTKQGQIVVVMETQCI